jgi:hypothetical protein
VKGSDLGRKFRRPSSRRDEMFIAPMPQRIQPLRQERNVPVSDETHFVPTKRGVKGGFTQKLDFPDLDKPVNAGSADAPVRRSVRSTLRSRRNRSLLFALRAQLRARAPAFPAFASSLRRKVDFLGKAVKGKLRQSINILLRPSKETFRFTDRLTSSRMSSIFGIFAQK